MNARESMMVAAQSWQAEGYAKNARFVADLGMPVVALLAARPGERILDLGCGDGVLTQKLAAMGCAVKGVDASSDMIRAARERGLDADVVDGTDLSFDAEFDAVFSNAALHWMTRPDAVIAGVRRALVPGGRFVGEFGGYGNVAAITTALIAVLQARGHDGRAAMPWYFPSPGGYQKRLEAQGFVVDSIDLIPRPTPLPTGIEGWLATFSAGFLSSLPEAERAPARAEAIELLRPSLCDEEGNWIADYVRLRFAAHVPAG